MRRTIFYVLAVAALLGSWMVSDVANAKDPIERRLRPGGNYMDSLKAQTRGSYSSSRSARDGKNFVRGTILNPTGNARVISPTASKGTVVHRSRVINGDAISPMHHGSSVVVSSPCETSVTSGTLSGGKAVSTSVAE